MPTPAIRPLPSHQSVTLRAWLVVLCGALCALLASPTIAQAEENIVRLPLADGFDYPVGPPDAKGYRKARGFWPNGHLGDDWNGVGGGNTDLGDPVYSIGVGYVVLSGDMRKGWGNTVIIRHAYQDPPSGRIKVVDSFYTHLDKIMVKKGQHVERGQKIGTIGTNRGMYLAHLHFEVRKNIYVGMHRTKYKRDFSIYWDPTDFIKKHRSLPKRFNKKVKVKINTFQPYK
ncbi:murein hydrolase activator EnvC family protein [Sulfuriroseicoccus oceanibius]|uniref:M23 family metallopeptidase n=1 Tax=Sulfuriroseicoccus oceanibius TaxID=2707525 RepID=A0A6B3LE27_9BACT|nr:M23 family metallopeptidase [Sulfuriroseicoccus oceanibius]QQL44406.1 M23 family metallopeptidase [Sulfuriroseicoccus oceanibius]